MTAHCVGCADVCDGMDSPCPVWACARTRARGRSYARVRPSGVTSYGDIAVRPERGIGYDTQPVADPPDWLCIDEPQHYITGRDGRADLGGSTTTIGPRQHH